MRMIRNRKRFRSLLALLMLIVMVASVFSSEAFAASEEELKQLKSERDELVKKRQEQQGVVDQLRKQQAGVLAVKQALDMRNMYTLWQLQLNQQEIEVYNHMIAEKNLEVEAAVSLEKEQMQRYRTRVRAMEENGNIGFLGLLLNASDLGEFLTMVDDVGEIMESDRELEDAYIEAREHTEAVRAEYEEYKAEIEEKQDELKLQQQELEDELEEANELINQIAGDIESNAAILEEFEAAERQAETNVANMVLALEKERQASQPSYGGGNAAAVGSFSWPAPTSTYITSRFGMRVHPVTGVRKSHTGMDIAANSGDNVLAAAAGKVTMAGVNGGYGNCVMIDHGNGYQTLYAHLSSISVSKGATVASGAVIGAVGSTGVSTGPHLHFEVWASGSRVDPEQFFTGLSFAASAGV